MSTNILFTKAECGGILIVALNNRRSCFKAGIGLWSFSLKDALLFSEN